MVFLAKFFRNYVDPVAIGRSPRGELESSVLIHSDGASKMSHMQHVFRTLIKRCLHVNDNTAVVAK
jgi:hypothetical protein